MKRMALWVVEFTAVSFAFGVGAAAAQWQASKNVEVIVQAGPGGASDQFARLIQRILHDQDLDPR